MRAPQRARGHRSRRRVLQARTSEPGEEAGPKRHWKPSEAPDVPRPARAPKMLNGHCRPVPCLRRARAEACACGSWRWRISAPTTSNRWRTMGRLTRPARGRQCIIHSRGGRRDRRDDRRANQTLHRIKNTQLRPQTRHIREQRTVDLAKETTNGGRSGSRARMRGADTFVTSTPAPVSVSRRMRMAVRRQARRMSRAQQRTGRHRPRHLDGRPMQAAIRDAVVSGRGLTTPERHHAHADRRAPSRAGLRPALERGTGRRVPNLAGRLSS